LSTHLFVTSASGATGSALRATAKSIRKLGFSRQQWLVGGNVERLGRWSRRRIRLGDDASAEWLVFVPAGDRVTREAIRVLHEVPFDVDVIYGDTQHDIERADRSPTYQRRPSYSPERLRSHDYVGGFVIAKRRVVEAAGGIEALLVAGSHDRNLRLFEHAARVVRIPEIFNITPETNLLPVADPAAVSRHLTRCNIDATVEFDAETPRVRVRRRLKRRPLVSVIVPTRGSSAEIRGVSVPLVVHAVRSLLERSTYQELEFVVVADTPTPVAVRDELKRLCGNRLVIADYDQAFNFALKNNIGVAHSSGEYVLLLNDDTEIITPDALETMLAIMQDSGVGIVGPLLHFEDGSIQSAGHVFTPDPTDMYRLRPADVRGAHNYVRVQREVSSVIAACLLTSRKIYEEVGGLSTQFPGNWNDIDFALKVQQAGYKVVFTPYAGFFHFESKTRVALRIETEVGKLGERWGDILDDDPYFNPRLQRFINVWRSDFHTNRSYEEALGPTAPIASK
jgi:GT2 family glycosyltransferase